MFEKLFTGVKVGRKAQKIGVRCKTVYEPDQARVLVQPKEKSNCFMIVQIIKSLYHIMLLMEQREMDFN